MLVFSSGDRESDRAEEQMVNTPVSWFERRRTKIGTHCVHVAVHALRTCLFTDTHSLTHPYMPNDIVGRALCSALPTKIKVLKRGLS